MGEVSIGSNIDVLLFALMAALSPMALGATLAVMRAGRVKALVFGTTFVVAQLGVCALLVALGRTAVPRRSGGHPTFHAILIAAFGVAMIWLGFVLRRRPLAPRKRERRRTDAVLDRLQHVRLWTAIGGGLLLGIGGPKRLLVTALAAASITASSYGGVKEAALVVVYGVVASVLVWAPVVAFVLAGDRAVQTIDEAGRWLAARQRSVMFYGCIGVGILAILDAIVTLVT